MSVDQSLLESTIRDELSSEDLIGLRHKESDYFTYLENEDFDSARELEKGYQLSDSQKHRAVVEFIAENIFDLKEGIMELGQSIANEYKLNYNSILESIKVELNEEINGDPNFNSEFRQSRDMIDSYLGVKSFELPENFKRDFQTAYEFCDFEGMQRIYESVNIPEKKKEKILHELIMENINQGAYEDAIKVSQTFGLVEEYMILVEKDFNTKNFQNPVNDEDFKPDYRGIIDYSKIPLFLKSTIEEFGRPIGLSKEFIEDIVLHHIKEGNIHFARYISDKNLLEEEK